MRSLIKRSRPLFALCELSSLTPLSLAVGLMVSGGASARPARVGHVPSGAQLGCFTCHLSAQGGATNAFGYDASLTLIGGTVQWDQLCALDSDLDGFTNGEELGDVDCVWRINDGPNPDGVLTPTNPGDPNSYPMEAPDLGPLPDMSPPLDLGPMMDMMVELDMAPLLPDADLWDAWLERPNAPDAFTLTPLDLSAPEEHSDLEPFEGGDMSGELDLGVEMNGTGGEQAGEEMGGAGPDPLPMSERKSSQETSLQDPYSGCESAPNSTHTPQDALLWALVWMGFGVLLRRVRSYSASSHTPS